MDATSRFAEIVQQPAGRLDEAALLIAAHGDPACDVAATLERLDDIAGAVPEPDLEMLCTHLFGTLGLAGDDVDYYDPRNSYLHEVLERRRGIPISLSVVLIEVGRRIGVPLAGVSTPAHFMVRAGNDVYVDAFAGGRLLDRAGMDQLFERLAPGVDLEPFLTPVGTVDVLRRMLANLVAIHQRSGDRQGLLWSTRLRTLLPGAPPEDHRAHAGALAANGDFGAAAAVFEELVADGRSRDPGKAKQTATRLRSRLN